MYVITYRKILLSMDYNKLVVNVMVLFQVSLREGKSLKVLEKGFKIRNFNFHNPVDKKKVKVLLEHFGQGRTTVVFKVHFFSILRRKQT